MESLIAAVDAASSNNINNVSEQPGDDSPDAAAGFQFLNGSTSNNNMDGQNNRNSDSRQQQQQQRRDRADVEIEPDMGRFAARAVDNLNPEQPTSPSSNGKLRPHPFFYYQDHSEDVDPDPFSPLTPPGRVPNFAAKMHAILARADFSDVVCWMPHGRAWRILKPREFESRVIPVYFEHEKLASFIRQANGWDFRRITTGPDRNCYYNELFLRGLPHLCKKLKRPGVAKKVAIDPDHEPDLYRISDMYPVPERYTDDTVLLHCVLEGGPNARMPVYTGYLHPSQKRLQDYQLPRPIVPVAQLDRKPSPVEDGAASNTKQQEASKKPAPTASELVLTPHDQEVLSAFQSSLDASETPFNARQPPHAPAFTTSIPSRPPLPLQTSLLPSPQPPFLNFLFNNSTAASSAGNSANKIASTLAMANQLAFPSIPAGGAGSANFAAGFAAAAASVPAFQQQANANAASSFAAGFAAATALSERNFQNMLASFSANMTNQLLANQFASAMAAQGSGASTAGPPAMTNPAAAAGSTLFSFGSPPPTTGPQIDKPEP